MPELIALANVVISLSFLTIFGLILAGLIRDWSLGVNPLGVATALVFLSCATGHALHAEQYITESEMYMGDANLSLMLVADSLTAVAGIGYLAQRRRYGLVIRGAHPMMDYQRRLKMAEALRDIGQDIAAQADFDGLLQRVVLHARDLLGADYAAIVTIGQAGKHSRQVSGVRSDGWDERAWNEAVFLTDEGPHGSMKDTARSVAIEDIKQLPVSKVALMRIHQVEGARSILAVPICSGDVVGGALMVAYRTRHPITQDDLSSSAALAGQAAVAIESARLIEGLLQADRLKDEFLSAAAHELRTPVTAIRGWTEMLLRSDGKRLDQTKALETIHRQTARLSRLSDDLVAVVNLKPGHDVLNQERFDLAEMVRQSVDLAQLSVDQQVFHVIGSGPLFVDVDRRLILETLSRLLENALRYSTGGKPVEVEMSSHDGQAIVSVTDHGLPIPVERQPYIFEPFYDPVPPGQHGYTGVVSLGLHLSKQIIDAHGGRMWLTTNQDVGSTFSFSLPLV